MFQSVQCSQTGRRAFKAQKFRLANMSCAAPPGDQFGRHKEAIVAKLNFRINQQHNADDQIGY